MGVKIGNIYQRKQKMDGSESWKLVTVNAGYRWLLMLEIDGSES